MANRAQAVPANVPGPWFVDSTCIDCDACRQLAPAVFRASGDYSSVAQQPATDEDRLAASLALLCCPTGSIGTRDHALISRAREQLPLRLDEGVYFCGYNAARSFGGNSYLLRRPSGNWLIDAPRYLEPLARRFEAWGGLEAIFLTHRDDVADAAKYARRFGARRVIHRDELAAQPDAEHVVDGYDPVPLAADLLAIPTPGHTRGHCALLYAERVLFTGDHLWWVRGEGRLGASRDYCWWSWPDQIRSLRRLLDYDFDWVLPGHGQRVQAPAPVLRAKLEALLARIEAGDDPDG